MVDLPIVHQRNPWYNSFLEKYLYIDLWYFVPTAAVYLCICVLNKVLEKIKTYLFLSHVARSLNHNSRLQPGSYESWENLL